MAAPSTSQKHHQEILFWSQWLHLSKYTLHQHIGRLHCLSQGFKETRFRPLTYFIHKNLRREISMAYLHTTARRLFIYAARPSPDLVLLLRDVIASLVPLCVHHTGAPSVHTLQVLHGTRREPSYDNCCHSSALFIKWNVYRSLKKQCLVSSL